MVVDLGKRGKITTFLPLAQVKVTFFAFFLATFNNCSYLCSIFQNLTPNIYLTN